MMTRRQVTAGITAGATLSGTAVATGPCADDVTLPVPRTAGGMPLMAALKRRHSTREYSERQLSEQTLSDLPWAAFGVNRPSGDPVGNSRT